MGTGAALVVIGASLALIAAAAVLVVRAVRHRPTGGAARTDIDPFAVPEPWRRPTADALAARRRFDAAVASMVDGPLRARMGEVGVRLDDGVAQLWEVARRGSALTATRRRIDTGALGSRLANAPDEETATALRSQLDTARRLDATIEEAERSLTRLVARLQQAATGVEELAARAGGTGDVDALDAEVTDAVSEVAALRDALDEARALGGTAGTDEPGTATGAP